MMSIGDLILFIQRLAVELFMWNTLYVGGCIRNDIYYRFVFFFSDDQKVYS